VGQAVSIARKFVKKGLITKLDFKSNPKRMKSIILLEELKYKLVYW